VMAVPTELSENSYFPIRIRTSSTMDPFYL
jgi:hypothetical protein